MRALLVTSRFPPDHSGSGKRLKETYERLRRAHPDFEYVVLTQSRAVRGDAGANVRYVPVSGDAPPSRGVIARAVSGAFRMFRDFRMTGRVLEGLPARDFDFVHTGGSSWMVFAACRWARRCGLPLIRELTSAADKPDTAGFFGWLTRQSLAWSRLVVTISPALEKSCAAAGFGGKVWCRPNPVDVSVFHPASADEKKRLRAELFGAEADGGEIRLVYVARICPWKNQMFLLDVLSGLPGNFRLVLVGPADPADRDYLDKLRSKIGELGLASRVLLKPESVPDVRRYLAACDVFVFPSPAEGLGNVVLEALCCGLPVAAHRIGGVTDWVVEEGIDGFLSPLEAEAFRGAVTRAVSLARKSADIARRAAARFSSAEIDAGYWERFNRVSARGKES